MGAESIAWRADRKLALRRGSVASGWPSYRRSGWVAGVRWQSSGLGGATIPASVQKSDTLGYFAAGVNHVTPFGPDNGYHLYDSGNVLLTFSVDSTSRCKRC